MNLALNNQQKFICYKTQTNKQTQIIVYNDMEWIQQKKLVA